MADVEWGWGEMEGDEADNFMMVLRRGEGGGRAEKKRKFVRKISGPRSEIPPSNGRCVLLCRTVLGNGFL